MAGLDLFITLKGVALSLGLIVAIGPQNAYVLRKGLKQRHVLAVVLTCFLADTVLLLLAAGGVGAFLSENVEWSHYAAFAGGAFLFWFGARSFLSAKKPDPITQQDVDEAGLNAQGKGLRAAIIMCLLLTYLNPHVYVDTFLIIGGVASQYVRSQLVSFSAGTIIGSGIWFVALGFGAQKLAPIFQSERAWRVLDVLIGIMMWSMSYYLISSHLLDGHV